MLSRRSGATFEATRGALAVTAASLLIAWQLEPLLQILTACALAVLAGRKWAVSIVALGTVALFAPWPVPALAAAIVALALDRARIPVREFPLRGKSLIAIVVVGAVCGGIAVAATVAQWTGTQLLVSEQWLRPWFVVPAVVGAAAFNALAEEGLWRAAWWNDAPSGSRTRTYATQVLSFGLAHARGIPGGVGGVALAGAFSAVVTAVRFRWGFWPAVAMHFSADLVIIGAFAIFATGASGFVVVLPQ